MDEEGQYLNVYGLRFAIACMLIELDVIGQIRTWIFRTATCFVRVIISFPAHSKLDSQRDSRLLRWYQQRVYRHELSGRIAPRSDRNGGMVPNNYFILPRPATPPQASCHFARLARCRVAGCGSVATSTTYSFVTDHTYDRSRASFLPSPMGSNLATVCSP